MCPPHQEAGDIKVVYSQISCGISCKIRLSQCTQISCLREGGQDP